VPQESDETYIGSDCTYRQAIQIRKFRKLSLNIVLVGTKRVLVQSALSRAELYPKIRNHTG
jgi:hypothetical protein